MTLLCRPADCLVSSRWPVRRTLCKTAEILWRPRWVFLHFTSIFFSLSHFLTAHSRSLSNRGRDQPRLKAERTVPSPWNRDDALDQPRMQQVIRQVRWWRSSVFLACDHPSSKKVPTCFPKVCTFFYLSLIGTTPKSCQQISFT